MKHAWTIPAALAAVFAWTIGLRPGGGWFSSDVLFRWQTDAMLRGTFALQPLPYHQRADWAWGAGSQHVWGLGVPFIRLPFEIAARAVGAPGFPDRLTFVILAAVVLWLLWTALDSDSRHWLERAAFACALVFFPAFLVMCRTRFAVYEEPVAYGYLWSIGLLALLLHVSRRPALTTACALALAAGAALLIRPTMIFYGAVTFVLAVVPLVRRAPIRKVAASAICFAAGPLAAMWTNWIRFLDPLEFGQRVNASRWPLDQFAKNFGYPFAFEPIASAARELFGAMFFVDRPNGVEFYGTAMYTWQSATVRFREFYFRAYDGYTLLLLLAAWTAIGWAIVTRRASRAVLVCGAWSLLAFTCQTVFYIRMPSMTSRYTLDFGAAIAVAIAGGLLVAIDAVDRADQGGRVTTRAIALAAVALWSAFEVGSAWIDPQHAARPMLTAAQAQVQRPPAEGPELPAGYRCGEDPSRFGVPFNGTGWNATGDCRVQAATTLYIRMPGCQARCQAPCLALEVAEPVDLSLVQVKYGTNALVRAGSTFCPGPGFIPNPTGVEIVSIGWVDPARLTLQTPVVLTSARSITRP